MGELGLGGVDGVHVHVRGQPSVEQHWTPDVRRDVFSVSKTFVSMAVGIAEAEGLLAVSDPILSHLDHLVPDTAAGVELITIEHLLTMTSGIVYRWDDPNTDRPGDPARRIWASPLGTEPGTTFAYRGGNSYLLSRIVHACSGQDLRDFLQPRLFTPLGIRSPAWQRCPLGFSLGAVGLSLRTEELSRLGQTLLDGGRSGAETRSVGLCGFPDQRPGRHHGTSGDRCVWSAPGERPVRTSRLVVRPRRGMAHGRHLRSVRRRLPRQQACITVAAHYRGPTTDILDGIWSHIVPGLR